MPTVTTNQATPATTSEKTASGPFATDQARQARAKALAEHGASEARERLENPYDNLACTD